VTPAFLREGDSAVLTARASGAPHPVPIVLDTGSETVRGEGAARAVARGRGASLSVAARFGELGAIEAHGARAPVVRDPMLQHAER
jgi:hypothetical protein